MKFWPIFDERRAYYLTKPFGSAFILTMMVLELLDIHFSSLLDAGLYGLLVASAVVFTCEIIPQQGFTKVQWAVIFLLFMLAIPLFT